jgi:hypothetical protein
MGKSIYNPEIHHPGPGGETIRLRLFSWKNTRSRKLNTLATV